MHLALSFQMKAIAISQDPIGWVHFLEGKVILDTYMQCNNYIFALAHLTLMVKIGPDNLFLACWKYHTQWVF